MASTPSSWLPTSLDHITTTEFEYSSTPRPTRRCAISWSKPLVTIIPTTKTPSSLSVTNDLTFPRLPLEILDMIWRETIEARTIHFEFRGGRIRQVDQDEAPIPVIARICRASRRVFLKQYICIALDFSPLPDPGSSERERQEERNIGAYIQPRYPVRSNFSVDMVWYSEAGRLYLWWDDIVVMGVQRLRPGWRIYEHHRCLYERRWVWVEEEEGGSRRLFRLEGVDVERCAALREAV